jgi:hypothetical protein
MRLVWKAFSLCKDGNREEENEDAIYPQVANGSSLNVDQFSCAMSDGATQASFSRLWANLLVKESGQSHNPQKDINLAVNTARLSWKASLPEKDLPWPVAIKIRQGSYATLLWFHIWQRNGLNPSFSVPADHGWAANAVGDTCLFQVIKGRFVSSFPLKSSKQFSNTPDLISTNTNTYRSRVMNNTITGNWQRGDHFLIASDALAHWFVSGLETGTLTWPVVGENITSLFRFQAWIRSLRRQGLIKNDDTSLICLTTDE